MLCGVPIRHDKGLAGHSDADVGIHALCDAIYGALAEGDIGRHFPPGEAPGKTPTAHGSSPTPPAVLSPGWDARQCRRHPDLRASKDRPACGRHGGRLAGILRIDASRVSVKATTTEKLGFTGRGEGIAAQAVATILLPE